jgi:hypothetical protein
MQRAALLRVLTLTLAFVHTFPARKHLAAFFVAPSLVEAWKGFGALFAIALYLLPVATQARGLTLLWKHRSRALRAAGLALAVGHAVPALDHLPRLIATWTFADAWRGLLSATAVIWFATPLHAQARLLAWLARAARLRPILPAQPAGARAAFESR